MSASNDWRSWAYRILALSNDVRAARNGKLPQRLLRRALGRATGRMMAKIR
jgi:hypothetical protein